MPQQIGAALKHESFYTQAISTDAAVINFGALPIARPAGATFAYGFLAGRTQDAIPDEANEVFACALRCFRPARLGGRGCFHSRPDEFEETLGDFTGCVGD